MSKFRKRLAVVKVFSLPFSVSLVPKYASLNDVCWLFLDIGKSKFRKRLGFGNVFGQAFPA